MTIRLTPREAEIYKLLTERGISNRQIADTLKISESSVKHHLGNIYQKFGVINRMQLITFKGTDQ
jgi:DNA-binding CsgD family transcriptional regulator